MHSHQRYNKHAASHRRAAQFMSENCGGKLPHKKHGGSVSRGNDSAMVMAKGQDSVAEDISAEGRGSKRRYAKGGKVKTSITVHVHPRPHVMLPAQGVTAGGPMMQAGPGVPPGAPMAGPGPGLPPGLPPQAMMPGAAPPMHARGGKIRAGAFTRKIEPSRRRQTPRRPGVVPSWRCENSIGFTPIIAAASAPGNISMLALMTPRANCSTRTTITCLNSAMPSSGPWSARLPPMIGSGATSAHRRS